MMQCSVILPVVTDNIATVSETLRSLAKVSSTGMEILCVCRGEAYRDLTESLHAAVENDDKLKVISFESDHGKQAAPYALLRDCGMKHAVGEYLLFPVPGDTYVTPHLVDAIDAAKAAGTDLLIMRSEYNPEGAAAGMPVDVPVQKDLLPETEGQFFAFQDLLVDAFTALTYYSGCVLFRSAFLEKHRLNYRTDGSFAEDDSPSENTDCTDFMKDSTSEGDSDSANGTDSDIMASRNSLHVSDASDAIEAMPFVFTAAALAEKIVISTGPAVMRRQNLSFSKEIFFSVPPKADYPLLRTQTEQSSFRRSVLGTWRLLSERAVSSHLEQDLFNYCLHAILWNLKALRNTPYEALYAQLTGRAGWLSLTGIDRREAGFWYSQTEYLELTHLLLSLNAEDYTFYRLNEAQRMLSLIQQENRKFQNATVKDTNAGILKRSRSRIKWNLRRIYRHLPAWIQPGIHRLYRMVRYGEIE